MKKQLQRYLTALKEHFQAYPLPRNSSKVNDELLSEFDSPIYSILKEVGKHNDVPDSEFDPHQLALGITIEKEHTNSYIIAKAIAKDHLSEPGLKDYYTRLIKMEREAKSENRNK
jgi:hypothetical protein